MTQELGKEHRAMLEASGISHEAIAARGYWTATSYQELKPLGFDVKLQCKTPGLVVPIFGFNGKVVSHQYRPDNPRETKEGRPIKYESIPNKPTRIDVPPTIRELIADPQIPLWITEGVRKADSAASRGLCCISLMGVWNWKGRNQYDGSVPIGDFENIPLKDRIVYIAYDSDAARNPQVKTAEHRLAEFLRSRGADVKVLRIPSADGKKVGLDDYFASGGTPEKLIILVEQSEGKEGRCDGAAKLLELIEKEEVELWHASGDDPYASYSRGEGIHHSSIRSGGAFESYCSRLYYRETKKAMGDSAKGSAIAVLAARAVHDGPQYPVERRIGWFKGSVYLALHDESGRVVEITKTDWQLIEGRSSPIRFVKPASARALAEPMREGSFDDLRAFVNVEDEDWPLIAAFAVGCFLPEGEFPLFAGVGEQGSGKSFGASCLRQLIDPNQVPVRRFPKDHEHLMAALNSGYLLAFDNLSHLSPDMSDALCCICSGAGFAARTLFTTADETVVESRRPILLNGIGEIVTRPDLADRTLLVRYRRLDGKGKEAKKLILEFEQARPRILGGLLDAVSRALARCEDVEPAGIRLQDFGLWALAAASTEDEPVLRAALQSNRAELQGAAIEHDAFAQAVIVLVEEASELRLSAGALLERLNRQRGNDRPPHDWPKNARAASSQLARIAPALRGLGFEVERLTRTGKSRDWLLRKMSGVGAESSQPSQSSRLAATEPETDDNCSDGRCDGPSEQNGRPSLGKTGYLNSEPVGSDGNDGNDGLDAVRLTSEQDEEYEFEDIA